MESTQVLECTQVLDSYSGKIQENPETPVKVATLEVDGVDYAIWNRENVIGRDSKCSIVLNSKAVSVEHAVIEADLQGGHFICDLGSTNKTKLGNVQLKPRVKYFINDGDSLKIANLKGVYRHESFSVCPIPPETSTLPVAEVTAIPGTPERKEEEDAVASIIAETPCKDEGNGAESSDGDIFGETADSSALFLGPLKLSSVDTKPVASGIDSCELIKTDASVNAERVRPVLSEVPKDVSVYAVASQSVLGDQSCVLKVDEMVNESSVCDADSSDLVVGSQPMFTPEKRLYDPTSLDCDPEPSMALDIVKDEEETLKKSDQWDNIDDSIDEISNQMDTIDSLVENNRLQVTYTPPKKKTDEPGLIDADYACKSNDLGNSLHSTKSDEVEFSKLGKLFPPKLSPNVKKFNKNKIFNDFEECLDVSGHEGDLVKANTEIGQKLVKSVVSENDDKPVSVYELATQDMSRDVSNVRIGVATVADSSVDESSDIIVGSQQIDSSEKSGRETNIFDVDTVPMEYAVNSPKLDKVDVYELDTQQMCSEDDVEGQKSKDAPNIYDLATQPFVIPTITINDIREEPTAAFGHSAKVTNQEEADISISDLPTQSVLSSADRVSLVGQQFGSVLENVAIQNFDVSISDLATQSVTAAKTIQETSSSHETSITDMPTQAVQRIQNDECLSKLIEEDPHDVSISDMATQAVSVVKTIHELSSTYKISGNSTQAVRKNQGEPDEEEDDSCEMSISDMATQQGLVHPNIQKKGVSEPHDTNSSAQPYRVTSRSESKVPNAVHVPQKNEHQDSEDIYNVMTQLPGESNHILEESNTKLINSEVQTSSHDISLSEMLTQPNGVKSDDRDEMHVAGVSLSKLPSQVNIAKNVELNLSESLKNKEERMMDEDTVDIFSVMTQLPVDNDKILLEESDTQLINSEVETATLDVSLSDMMTQPSKSTSGITRESPVLDMSISDLPTQSTTAKTDRVVDQDSEDIYNVMTQMPVEKENILLDESDTQQINTDVENDELRMIDSAVKQISDCGGLSTEGAPSTMASVEVMKNNDILFKIPTPIKDRGKVEVSKGDHIDVYNMDTQPMDFQASRKNSNLVDDRVNKENTAAKNVLADVQHSDDIASDVRTSSTETQDAINHLPNNPVVVKDVVDDIFEVDTMPMSDLGKAIIDTLDKPKDANGRNSITTDDVVVAKSAKKVTKSSFGEHSVASTPQEIDPNSVEGRIRALSDKNVNSLATQQILVSSNTKSTVAELLETLEDTSSQMVRINRKVKRLDYTDFEDSHSNVTRVQRKAKEQPESDSKEATVKDEVVQSEFKIYGTKSESASDDLSNGDDKLPRKFAKEGSHNVIVNESSKITISESLKGDSSSGTVERKKGISVSNSKLASDDSVAVAEKVESVKVNVVQMLKVENTGSCLPGSSRTAETLTIEADEKSVTGSLAINNTAESELLQLEVSADASVNKSNVLSNPATPEKQAAAVTVMLSTHRQNLLVDASPHTPEALKDFSGTNPMLRQYDSGAVAEKFESVEVNVIRTLEVKNTESCLPGSSKIAENLIIEADEKSVTGKSAISNPAESELLQLEVSAGASLNKYDAVSTPATPEKQAIDAAATVTPSAHKQNVLAERSPDTPVIPKDFFGTPIFRDKPVLRQYVNKKKLSLSSTSLLKGPNASSTPKSDIGSHSVIDMEETLQPPMASVVKTCKIYEKAAERNTVDEGSNTPKNVKKFKKVSPQKRKSSEVVEQQPEENNFVSSQESFDSQEFGRGKRKKLKKSFFGSDDSKEFDSFTIKSFRKDLESEYIQQTGPHSTSSMKPLALDSPTDENKINSGEEADKDKKRNEELPPKRQFESELCSSDSSSMKKVKLDKDVAGTSHPSNNELNDTDLTCVPGNCLQEGVTVPVINKRFRGGSSKKIEPVCVNVMPKNESDVKSAISCEILNNAPGERRNVSTPKSDFGKDVPVPHTKKVASVVPTSASEATSSSASLTKSLRGRKRTDIKVISNPETEPSTSIQKAKRNRVQSIERSSQEVSDAVEESDSSQEISIKIISKNVRKGKKNNMKFEEGKINQQSEQREQSRQNLDNCRVQMKEEGDVRKERREPNSSGSAAERVSHECSATAATALVSASSNTLEELPTSKVSSPKKVVKRRGRPRKVDNENEEFIGTTESISNIKPSKCNTTTRMGRRKLVKTDEDSVSIPVSVKTQSPASSQEVLPSKRGRKGGTDNSVSVTKEETADTTELSDTLHAPSTSKTNISKTRGRCRTPATIEDYSALETDQDSQSQDLSQGRRSGRERKKKEAFDEIMSRKEEELRLKKLQRNSNLSQGSDKSRSTSRASIASSSKTEADGAVTSAPLRRGRPKKPTSVASTPSSLLVNEASTFSVPASVPSSPAGSNSSKRRTPRSGSASSSQSVESLPANTKRKQESQKIVLVSPVKVMFTGLADAKLSSMVKKLGGKVVEKPADCTVLVTDKARRTVKFLCALGLGKPIVSPNWLSKSKAFNQFTDPYVSLLKDGEAEEKFDFQLNESLEKAQHSRLLEGYSFYVTASVLPPPAEIKPIVECSGGKYLVKPPAKWPSNAAIISTPKDKSGWAKLSKHGVLPPILSAEALLSGVLQQQFDLGRHRLK